MKKARNKRKWDRWKDLLGTNPFKEMDQEVLLGQPGIHYRGMIILLKSITRFSIIVLIILIFRISLGLLVPLWESSKKYHCRSYEDYLNTGYMKSIKDDSRNAISYYLERGLNINTIIIKKKQTNTLYFSLNNSGISTGTISFLIDKGADVKINRKSFSFGLLVDAMYDSKKLALALIEKGANVTKPDFLGMSVLDHAVRTYIPVNILKALFESGAKITSNNFIQNAIKRNRIGYRELQYLFDMAERQNIPQKIAMPFDAILHRDIDKLRKFLEEQKDHINNEHGIFEYGIRFAAANGFSDVIKTYMDCGYKIYDENKKTLTCIQIAAMHGQLDVIKMLVEAGEDVNKISTGEYSIVYAANNNNKEIVKFLLENGADKFDLNIHYLNSDQYELAMSALTYAGIEMSDFLLHCGIVFHPETYSIIPLELLERGDSLEKLKYLQMKGFDINIKRDDIRPFYLLVHARREDVPYETFAWLLDNSFEDLQNNEETLINMFDLLLYEEGQQEKFLKFINTINYKYSDLLIPIYKKTVARGNYTGFVELIKKYNLPVEQKNKLLYSDAAKSYNHKFTEYLINAGADINSIDEEGNTAIMNAADAGQYDNIKILFEAGADISIKNKKGKTVKDIIRKKRFYLAEKLIYQGHT